MADLFIPVDDLSVSVPLTAQQVMAREAQRAAVPTLIYAIFSVLMQTQQERVLQALGWTKVVPPKATLAPSE